MQPVESLMKSTGERFALLCYPCFFSFLSFFFYFFTSQPRAGLFESIRGKSWSPLLLLYRFLCFQPQFRTSVVYNYSNRCSNETLQLNFLSFFLSSFSLFKPFDKYSAWSCVKFDRKVKNRPRLMVIGLPTQCSNKSCQIPV